MVLHEKLDGNKLFFMSDLHIGHENILKFADRGWSNIKDHDDWILGTIESETMPGDIIVDLGDMFWKKHSTTISEFFEKFKDRRWLKVLGNHDVAGFFLEDNSIRKNLSGVYDILDLTVEYNGNLTLVSTCHYPMISWNRKPHGAIHLFGHCHGNIDPFTSGRPDLMVDVGVDGSLAKRLGTFVIPFKSVLDHFVAKTGGTTDFKSWTKNNSTEL